MSVMLSAPRGTQDVLPSQSGKWQFVEETARKTAATGTGGEGATAPEHPAGDH